MVLRARSEGIHQTVDIIAGRVENLAADYHGGRGRSGSNTLALFVPPEFPRRSLLGISVNRGNGSPLALDHRACVLSLPDRDIRDKSPCKI